MSVTWAQKAEAFCLQSKLGMTIENRRHHACAQIGHVHYGYRRFRDCDSEEDALFLAIVDCAESYYSHHPEERPDE